MLVCCILRLMMIPGLCLRFRGMDTQRGRPVLSDGWLLMDIMIMHAFVFVLVLPKTSNE